MNDHQDEESLEIAFGPSEGLFARIFCFELSLAILAVIVGWLLGKNPLERFYIKGGGWESLGLEAAVGLVGTLPMICGLVLLDRYPIGPMRGLKQLTEERLVPMFAQQTTWQLFLVSLAAGFGEETLYRGLIQSELVHRLPFHPPVVWGCLIASLLFGACHYLSTTYAVLATLMGLYWGAVFELRDSLVAPMVMHTLYDFFALAYFVKWKRR